jgi:hypothetical protein
MATLVDRCRKRCDKNGDESLSDSDLKTLISEVYGELYSTVAETGHRYFETSSTITTTGAASYSEPSDHLGTVRVERVTNTTTGETSPLREVGPQEQCYWNGSTGTARVFALVDDQLYLYPKPASGETYHILYIPQPPDLSTYADADVVDVVSPAGESFLIWGVAAIAKGQTEGDVNLALQQKEKARELVLEWAVLRSFQVGIPREIANADEWSDYVGADRDPAGWWNR